MYVLGDNAVPKYNVIDVVGVPTTQRSISAHGKAEHPCKSSVMLTSTVVPSAKLKALYAFLRPILQPALLLWSGN
jgi:hypothetical protein